MNKAELGRYALELRSEIGLGPQDALDPYKLAKQWGIEVYAVSDIDCSREVHAHFSRVKDKVWSGMLIPVDAGAVIVENDAHDPLRRRSTLAHEMAHVVRHHEFGKSLVDERGCRTSSGEDEKEAAYLAGELLIPIEAAKWMAFRDYTNEQAAARFAVSVHIAQWRMDATGARKIVANARRKSAAGR